MAEQDQGGDARQQMIAEILESLTEDCRAHLRVFRDVVVRRYVEEGLPEPAAKAALSAALLLEGEAMADELEGAAKAALAALRRQAN